MELLSLQKSLKNQEVNEVNTAGSLHLSMCPFLWTGRPWDPHRENLQDNCRTTNRRMCDTFFSRFSLKQNDKSEFFTQKTSKHRTELRILACANSSCPFRLHPEAHLGGFCCTSLLASDAPHDVQSATWREFWYHFFGIRFSSLQDFRMKLWSSTTVRSVKAPKSEEHHLWTHHSPERFVGLPAGIQHQNSYLSHLKSLLLMVISHQSHPPRLNGFYHMGTMQWGCFIIWTVDGSTRNTTPFLRKTVFDRFLMLLISIMLLPLMVILKNYVAHITTNIYYCWWLYYLYSIPSFSWHSLWESLWWNPTSPEKRGFA